MKRTLKTWNSNLVIFLSGNNTVIITNPREALVLQQKLANIGLLLRDFYKGKPIAVEYNNGKGFTFYNDIQQSIDWYGEEPIKLEELEF